MGDYNNRYYGGMNKEGQIHSNSFHSRTSVRKYSYDKDKFEQKENLSSVSSSAAQTAGTTATSTTVVTSSSAAISTTTAVAGGTAAAVATATVVVVASAIFVPSVNEFKYESTANTISYSFNLSYKNAESAVVTLENRLEKYEQTFKLESFFAEEEMTNSEEGIIQFEEGRFIDLTPSTTYNLSIAVLDGENTYGVFSERVKTNDVPTSDFVITANLALNEETQCLEGTIDIDDPGHYYENESLYAEIIGNRSQYPETVDMSGNPFEENFDEELEQLSRVYEISDLSATQSFYVGGFDGGESGLSLTIYAKSSYDERTEAKPYFHKSYQYIAPVYYVTFNFYNDDGTVLWDSQTIPYGEQVFYNGSVDLEEEASRRSADSKHFFLGWANSVGGEPYDGEMYAFEDRNYYAVFGEKNYTVTLYDGNYIIYRTTVSYGDTFCIDESEAAGYDFFKEPDANGCYSFDHYEDEDGNTVLGYDEITVTKDINLYAEYVVTSQSVHTVFYDYDGSVLQDNYQQAYFGIYYDYSMPTREGETADDPTKYRFTGWSSPELDGHFSNDDLKELDVQEYAGETITFTATYEEGEYIITFLSEDGSEVLARQYAYEGDEIFYPYDTPEKEGTAEVRYVFVGWDTEPNGTHGLIDMPSVTGDAFYYACFIEEPNEHTITFYNGQEVVTTISVPDGESFCIDDSEINSEDFYKEPDANGCYSFNHFEDEEGNTVFGYEELTITEDRNFYATFSITSQSVHTVFKNSDGTVLQDNYQMAYYGLEYSGDTPHPPTEYGGATVVFVGWYCEELGRDVSQSELSELDVSSFGGGLLTFTANYTFVA